MTNDILGACYTPNGERIALISKEALFLYDSGSLSLITEHRCLDHCTSTWCKSPSINEINSSLELTYVTSSAICFWNLETGKEKCLYVSF